MIHLNLNKLSRLLPQFYYNSFNSVRFDLNAMLGRPLQAHFFSTTTSTFALNCRYIFVIEIIGCFL